METPICDLVIGNIKGAKREEELDVPKENQNIEEYERPLPERNPFENMAVTAEDIGGAVLTRGQKRRARQPKQSMKVSDQDAEPGPRLTIEEQEDDRDEKEGGHAEREDRLTRSLFERGHIFQGFAVLGGLMHSIRVRDKP